MKLFYIKAALNHLHEKKSIEFNHENKTDRQLFEVVTSILVDNEIEFMVFYHGSKSVETTIFILDETNRKEEIIAWGMNAYREGTLGYAVFEKENH